MFRGQILRATLVDMLRSKQKTNAGSGKGPNLTNFVIGCVCVCVTAVFPTDKYKHSRCAVITPNSVRIRISQKKESDCVRKILVRAQLPAHLNMCIPIVDMFGLYVVQDERSRSANAPARSVPARTHRVSDSLFQVHLFFSFFLSFFFSDCHNGRSAGRDIWQSMTA